MKWGPSCSRGERAFDMFVILRGTVILSRDPRRPAVVGESIEDAEREPEGAGGVGGEGGEGGEGGNVEGGGRTIGAGDMFGELALFPGE